MGKSTYTLGVFRMTFRLPTGGGENVTVFDRPMTVEEYGVVERYAFNVVLAPAPKNVAEKLAGPVGVTGSSSYASELFKDNTALEPMTIALPACMEKGGGQYTCIGGGGGDGEGGGALGSLGSGGSCGGRGGGQGGKFCSHI